MPLVINDHAFNQFTIEASVKFNNLDGWQTFLGKATPLLVDMKSVILTPAPSSPMK